VALVRDDLAVVSRDSWHYWVGYRFIPGRPFDRRRSPGARQKPQQVRLADHLAAFLQSLHNAGRLRWYAAASRAQTPSGQTTTGSGSVSTSNRGFLPLLWNDRRASVAHHFARVRDGRSGRLRSGHLNKRSQVSCGSWQPGTINTEDRHVALQVPLLASLDGSFNALRMRRLPTRHRPQSQRGCSAADQPVAELLHSGR
jgi:hypothetical protein